MESSIVQIGNCLVSSEILTECFACDYEKCKGCCCVIGDSGAPLSESEPEEIEKNYPLFSPLMPQKGREVIEKTGFFEIDTDGDMVTPLVPGSEECAYACFGPEGECFCSMEKRWCEGQGDFRKPISCQLYPIRVSSLGSGMIALNLHRWDICRDAFEKGRKEDMRVYEFLREPIVRQFGEYFYDALCMAAVALGR